MDNRNIRRKLAAGLLAAVAIWGIGEAIAQDRADAGPALYGEAVNGLRVALKINPTSWQPGHKIAFSCTVENVSKKPIRVAAWGLDLMQALEITDANGNVLKYDGGRDATRPVPPDAFPTIAAGGTKRFTLTGRLIDRKMLVVNELLGGVWTWRLSDGEYTVRAVFDRPPDDEWMRRQADGPYWTGKAFSAPVKATVGEAGPRAGEPVNGLKLTLKAEETRLKMTAKGKVEPTQLTLTFTNVGAKPIKLNTYDLWWSLINLEVEGPEANSIQVITHLIKRMMIPPTPAHYPTLKPGESWTDRYQPRFPRRFGTTSYALLKPGEYHLKVTYTSTERHQRMGQFAAGSWVGSVTSNEVVLKVTAPKGK